MDFAQAQDKADKYFEQDQLQSAFTLYKKCVEQNLQAYTTIQGLGNIEDQRGCNFGRIGQWYCRSKRQGILKGSPIQAIALIFSHNSYINFAKDYIKHLLSLHPSNYQFKLILGHVESNLRNYRKAQSLYEQAISINSYSQHGYYAMSSLFFYNFNDELKARQFAIKTLYCNKSNILAKIILEYTSIEYYQAKIIQLKKIHQSLPQLSAKTNNLIGCLLYQNQQYIASRQYFKLSIDQSDKYLSPLVGLGATYIQTQQYSLAQEHFQTCLKIDPGCQQALKSLGVVCLSTQRYEDAIQWFYSACQCNQDDFQTYYGLGNCYYMQQDFNSAIDWFEQALLRNDHTYEVYQCLGNCYIANEEYESALQYYQKCFELNNSVDALIEIIKIQMKCQKYCDAVKKVEQNLSIICQNHYIVYFLSGNCYLMLDLYEQAQQSYQTSLRYNPQFKQSIDCLQAMQSFISISQR